MSSLNCLVNRGDSKKMSSKDVKEMHKKLGLWAVIAICEIVSVQQTQAQSARNVILVIADDLGSDFCGFSAYHLDTVKMPNVRRLLARGVHFENLWSNPLCSPTRSGIITGRYSFRTGVGDAIGGLGEAELDTGELTIPRLLKRSNANIGTANIGKWHLQAASPKTNWKFPNAMGYDLFAGNFVGTLPNYSSYMHVINGVGATSTNYATTEQVNEASAWVKTQKDKPFFLWLAFNAPHTPYHLPPAGLHSYTSLTGTAADISANKVLYFKAMVEAMDHELGRLFDTLQKYNFWDNTDIIFIGDNGDDPAVAQSGSAKGSVYNDGVSVPLIISGPTVVAPNRSTTAIVNTQDLFATILELMKVSNWSSQISASKPVDSKSLLPIIKNQSNKVRDWTFTEIFKNTPATGDGKAMRDSDYKLLDFDNGTQKFYNLTLDPQEAKDLLPGTLSTIDKQHYAYLCDEMSKLVGINRFCDLTGAGVKEPILPAGRWQVQPNPFEKGLLLLPNVPRHYRLSNALGDLIYEGENLSEQDFSAIASGFYLLVARDLVTGEIQKFKLMK